jgi:membrane-bound lytic murein transglycosylase D
MTASSDQKMHPVNSLFVKVHDEKGHPAGEHSFTSSFRIGRSDQCEIIFKNKAVSRNHAEVIYLVDKWWINDLNSGNGTYLNGRKIDRAPLTDQSEITLGPGGPRLTISVGKTAVVTPKDEDDLSLTHYRDYYLSESNDENVGQRTMMVRRAFAEIQKEQKKKYGGIILFVTCLFLLAGSLAVYKHQQVLKQRKLAGEIFYAMKSLDLEFADFLRTAREKKDPESIRQVNRYRKQRLDLENNYSKFIDSLEVYEKSISEQERVILRMARTFGECEIFMPKDFVSEVLRYIDKWKSSGRLANAIARAEQNGYTETIVRTMLLYDLPPHFFYLALQESNFDVNAVGPQTRWGIAKGMWQFIPTTATYYGLKTGPLRRYRRSDPQDERQNFEKSTVAAAKYIRSLYDTEAQASGLLVMACYNWGENRVNRMVDEMPMNPRQRNFWQFLLTYRKRIPRETYDYVFMIFSAAVIGENPQIFGFDFTNPLAKIDV